MSGVMFILHGGADEGYAAELAGALAPLPIFPINLDGAAQFGLGSVCVVAWTQNMLRAGMAGAVLKALPESQANAIICVVDGAPLPAELSARASAVAQLRGPIAGYAAHLQNMITNRQHELAQRNPRGATAPQLGSQPKREAVRAPVKQNMAVRSAYSLAATLAAVGFVAPAIGERASATGPTEAPTPGAATAAVSVAETTTLQQETRVEPAAASALDLWLTTGSVTEAEAAPAEAPAVEAPATMQLAALSLEPLPAELVFGKAGAQAGPTLVVAEPGAVAFDKNSRAEIASAKPATLASDAGADAASGAE